MHPYEQIRAELLRRINTRAWPAGHSIPHEEKLAEEFGVARGTVRRALAGLVDAGLIERRKRAGTRVTGRKGHSSTLTIPLVRHDIEEGGHAYSYRLLSDEMVRSGADDPFFAVAELRHICCLHLSDEVPFQLEDRLINTDAVPEAKTADFSAISPNEWLIQQVPYSAVRTILRAGSASKADSVCLDLTKAEPVFLVERQTRLDEVPLTRVRLSHPASRYEIVTQTDHFLGE